MRNVRRSRNGSTRCEHWACGEGEQCQSYDQAFHFRSPLFDLNPAPDMDCTGREIISCLENRAFNGIEFFNLFRS
jgi:hypothetical protein